MTERALKLTTLLKGVARVQSGQDPSVTGLCLDSRWVRSGDAFVALAGRAGHGIDFFSQARAAGAVALIHDGRAALPDEPGMPVVEVDDLAGKLPELAQRFWGESVSELDLVAVTGTNGKSSVAWLLAQALDGAMIGTLGVGRPGRHEPGSLTTPDIFSVYRQLAEFSRQGVGSVVLEASSHALDQGRLDGLSFSSVIFTTLGHDHLDYHADRAAYGEAKARLFTEFHSRRQIINLDDAFGQTLPARIEHGRAIGYSLSDHPEALATARLLRADTDGLAAEFDVASGRFQASSRLVGRINLYNLLVVAAELSARGRCVVEIENSLSALEPVPGRMEPVRRNGGPLALIDYAHTPDALENALTSARGLSTGNLWCVFGCGGDRDREKRPRMGRIAERLADRIVLTDDNPRHEDGLAIIRAIQAGMEQPQRSIVIRERSRAIAHALSECGADDVVLVAGKGHETDQVIGDERIPCDDHHSVRDALGAAA